VRVSWPQSFANAGADAAAATLMAYCYKAITGEGQHVDVSVQPSLQVVVGNAVPFWALLKKNVTRAGPFRLGISTIGVAQRQIWNCKDGYLAFVVMGGMDGAKTNSALVKWMDSKGQADDFLKAMQWEKFGVVVGGSEEQCQVEERFGKFFRTHTKAELWEKAKSDGIMIYPFSTIKEVMESTQLAERKYFIKVQHPELGTEIEYPGSFFLSNETAWCNKGRAPFIGEHNYEIYGELGLSKQELVKLKQANVI
jgi:crotonobetainyl-CoA:carnitine CoA-transferase CaiB-like acyl-CoA transferase